MVVYEVNHRAKRTYPDDGYGVIIIVKNETEEMWNFAIQLSDELYEKHVSVSILIMTEDEILYAPSKILKGQILEAGVCCAVVPGTTILTTCVALNATLSSRRIRATALVFAVHRICSFLALLHFYPLRA